MEMAEEKPIDLGLHEDEEAEQALIEAWALPEEIEEEAAELEDAKVEDEQNILEFVKPEQRAAIAQEIPDNCDSCGAGIGSLNPIQQTVKRALGNFTQVVGYYCEKCEVSHLYRIEPERKSTGRVIETTLSDIPDHQTKALESGSSDS